MDLKTYTFLCFVIPYFTIGNISNRTKLNITEAPKIKSNFKDLNFRNKSICKQDDIFELCRTCTKFCENESYICTEPCGGSCFCNKNLVTNIYDQCIDYEECSNSTRNYPVTKLPISYQLVCGLHQQYSSCRRCDRTCTDPVPPCNGTCMAGCFCEDGYFKAPDGSCILLKDCPEATMTIGIGSNDPSIDECHPDEVFVWCGWCEGSCSEPAPQCPETTCTRGCLCRPPLLRHYTGLCVEEKDCLPKKCSNPNEEYACRYGCEARCNAHACTRPRRCRLGCHCKRGLLRSVGGNCVKPNECFRKNSTN